MQMEKWLFELKVLALRYDVVDHKNLQIFKQFTWVCIMVLKKFSYPYHFHSNRQLHTLLFANGYLW
jgi:hypothetical protein